MGRQKGNKRERQARELLERADYLVETPNYQKYSNKDFWNLFDLMATRPDQPIRFVQVKSNRAEGVRSFADEVATWFDLDRVDVQMWVCLDREGWRVLDVRERRDGSGGTYTTVLDERDFDRNMGEAVVDWLQPNVA